MDHNQTDDLRRKAEELFNDPGANHAVSKEPCSFDAVALLHELQVHQIELEIQNDELRIAKLEAEVALTKFTDLFDFAPFGFFTLDNDRFIREVNLAGADLLGIERSYLMNKPFELYILTHDRPSFKTFCHDLQFSGVKQKCELELLKTSGEKIYAYIEGTAMDTPSVDYRLAVIDITKRKNAERALAKANDELETRVLERTSDLADTNRALKESEERYRQLVETMQYAMTLYEVVTDVNGHPVDLRFLAVNQVTEQWLKFSREQLIGRTVRDMFPSYDPEEIEIYTKVALTGEAINKEQYNSTVGRWLSISAFSPRSSQVVSVLGDITERKEAEEKLLASNQILEGIINTIPARVFWKDNNLVFLGCNKIFAQDAGFTDTKDIIGKDDRQMVWRDQAELYRADDREVIESGLSKLLIEESQTTPDGKSITLLTNKIPLVDPDGKIIGVLGTYMDITERKQAEDKIIASLQEKEVLLKEIHHRVKNNLQIISALLSLQSSYLTDEDVIKIFRDSQNRIKSMALVHENLYRSKDFDKIDFNEYIDQLVANLSQSYGDLAGKIKFYVYSENVYLNINTAIPCGMIINELISNSIKHAFPGGRSGKVCIDLSSKDNGFRLVVSDNGIGIKGDINIKDSNTLGFRLIDTLVKQIHGTMKFDATNGTRVEIHFRELKKEQAK